MESVQEPQMSAQAKIQLLYPEMLKLRESRRKFDVSSFIYNFIQGTVSATKIEKYTLIGELQDPFTNI